MKDVEQTTKMPKGWKWVKLGDIVDLNPKIPNKDSIKDDMEVQFLPMKLVEEVVGKIHLIELRKYSEVQKSYTSFIDGDVIFAKVTPCMENGKIAVVDNLKNGVGFGSSEFHVIRPSNALSNKYLFNYIVQNRFRNEAQNEMTGAVGLRRVPKQFIENYQFPLPPLQEQHAIVSRIEELLSELEKGKQQLETAQQQLKIYRQAVLKWAFEGKLTSKDIKDGELPQGWKQTTLGEIISISSGNGLTRSKRNDDGDYLVYGGNGVTGSHSEYLFEDEQLIIGRVGVHCGNPYITKPKSWVTDNAFVVSFDERVVSKNFLLHLIKVLNLNKYSVSTAQPVISQGKLYPIEISIPPREEQNLIVEEIESRLSVCDKVEETINTSLQQAETLRQSILKKAFEGKLV